jgi:Zn finger protein HypA/HybF involved in hydrogenase expression
MAPRTSILNDKEKLIEAIANSNSSKEVLICLGLRAAGGNYNTLKKAAELFDLELPKYEASITAGPSTLGQSFPRYSNEEIFIENSPYHNRHELKKRMYRLGYKEECTECGLGPEWNGKPITLQLDHINGVHNDNRLENLRIICPNCHSQTKTFAGRGSCLPKLENSQNIDMVKVLKEYQASKPPRRIRIQSLCIDCEASVPRNTKRCSSCADTARQNRYNVTYPAIDVLIEQLTATNFVKVAKDLGVSDNALRKHLRKHVDESHPLLNKKKKPVIL